MSADDNDPRHLSVARVRAQEMEQLWTRERHRNEVLVSANDQLRAELAKAEARVKQLEKELDFYRQSF